MKTLLGGLLAGLLLGATGCATAPVVSEEKLLEGAADHVLYKQTPEELAELTRALLVHEGYELLPTTDPLYIRTTWRIDGELQMGAWWSRCLIQLHPMGNGLTAVRAYEMRYMTNGRAASHPGSFAGQRETKGRNSEGNGGAYVLGEPLSPTKPTVERASKLEWALLEKVAPVAAQRLRTQAEGYLAEHKANDAHLDELAEQARHEPPPSRN